MPCCKVSQAAFIAYRRAGRVSQLLFDLWEAVQVFAGVYRSLGAEIATAITRLQDAKHPIHSYLDRSKWTPPGKGRNAM